MTQEPNKTTDLRFSESYQNLEDRNLDDGIIPWVVEFRVLGTPDILRASTKHDFVIGRADSDSKFTPDIDLSGYKAQELGVSRRHARFLAQNNRVTVEDLSSANGTFINGKVINVHEPYRIYEGDVIMLGKLQLQVHFVVKPSIHDETQIGLEDNLNIQPFASGQRLVIVDDNFEVSMLMRIVARRAGLDAHIAHTFAEAITLIDAEYPKGLIVEMMLIDGSGGDLIRYVRSLPGCESVPIIATTEATGGYKIGEALTQGADIFIGKPLALDEFVNGLTKLVAMMPA